MSATKNGGPAFPQAHHSISVSDAEGARELLGMSLRDWFAGKSLDPTIASYIASKKPCDTEIVAKHCYDIADAMLAAREGKEAQ